MGRALMSRPALLLLGEPSLGLATLSKSCSTSIVRAINGQGTTVCLLEQNARKSLAIARGYVLQKGEIVGGGDGGGAARLRRPPRAYLAT